MDSGIERLIGELTAEVRNLNLRFDHADANRAMTRDKLEEINRRIADVDHRQKQADDILKSMQPVIKEFLEYKTRAQGAGILGRGLWWTGGVLLGGAYWLYNHVAFSLK